MKIFYLFAFACLCRVPAIAAVSLDPEDESSIFRSSELATEDLGKKAPATTSGAAGKAFAAGKYDEAIRLAMPRAEAGDPDAIYLLGFANETGSGVSQSTERAIGYYRLGAAKGHADSIYRLAMNLAATGDAVQREEARVLLEREAEKGAAVAGRVLGELFIRGSLTEKPDAESAVQWWKKSSAAGDVSSMNFLAAFYDGQMGFPEKQDAEMTLQYYGAAAGKGDTSAMINLGSRLLTGEEALRDEKKGKEMIAKAIAADNASGYLVLGAYEAAVKKDAESALAEYLKGAEAGQVDCMIRAAGMYNNGEGAEKDETKATELLKNATEAGSAQAHLELAGMILGKEQPDLATGYAHLLTAANGGLAFAQNELGIFYLSGRLGVADISAAVSWFSRAAQANFPPAQNNLAALHERGAGVAQNFQNALQLYALAAQQGHPGATLSLARLHAAGAGTDQNLELAWALATVAGERGDGNSAAFIAEVEKGMSKEQLEGARKEFDRLKSGKAAE